MKKLLTNLTYKIVENFRVDKLLSCQPVDNLFLPLDILIKKLNAPDLMY